MTDFAKMTPAADQYAPKAVGRRLRSARQARGLSLSELAERTEHAGWPLGKSRISNYEQGIRRLPIEAAVCLAGTLGNITAAQLLGLTVELSHDLTPEEVHLIQAYRAGSVDQKSIMIVVADATQRRRTLGTA